MPKTSRQLQADIDAALKTKTAKISVGKGTTTEFDEIEGGKDYPVVITVDGKEIRGQITMAPSEGNNGRMMPIGDSIDGWCDAPIVRWLVKLTRKSMSDAVQSLKGGAGTEEIEVEYE